MGYTVRRIEPNTVLESVVLSPGKVYQQRSPRSVTFGVFDSSGTLVKARGNQFEIYPRKQTAQSVADHYNGQTKTQSGEHTMANEQAKKAILKAAATRSVKSNARLVAKLRRSGYLELEDALGKLVQEAQQSGNPEVVKNLQSAHALARQIIAPMVRAIRALESEG